MNACENITGLSRELGVSRCLLYTWRYRLEPPDAQVEGTVSTQNSRESRLLREVNKLDLIRRMSQVNPLSGAPQPGFSRHILRIRSRTSRETSGRPGLPRRTFQVQNNRKPARCQAMTVSGWTMASAERQSLQTRDSQTHNRRSPGVNFGRVLADLRSTPIWWRGAKFSSWRVARERKIEDRVACSGVREMRIRGE
jgi:hypothetical protein